MRVAVVGAGPSGLYATDALTSAGHQVDVIERLPVPFGLVRYGVAPDHFSIRSVRNTLEKILNDPSVRLLAGVEVGVDVSVQELLAAYDAVILTYGAARDRRLDIEGEELAGSIAATGGLAKLLGEKEFPVHYHQGQRDNLHISLVSGRMILVVVFDERSSLGLVRLRVKKASAQLAVGLLFVQQLQEDQVRDLFDIGDGVRHAACPKDVGDVIELAAKLLIHVLVFQMASGCSIKRPGRNG